MVQLWFHWCLSNCTSLIKLNVKNTKHSTLYENTTNVKEEGRCVFTHVLVFPCAVMSGCGLLVCGHSRVRR